MRSLNPEKKKIKIKKENEEPFDLYQKVGCRLYSNGVGNWELGIRDALGNLPNNYQKEIITSLKTEQRTNRPLAKKKTELENSQGT